MTSQGLACATEEEAKIEQVLPAEQLWGFRGVYLETAQRLKAKQMKWGDESDELQQLDFACGFGSLLLKVRKQLGKHGIFLNDRS